MSPEVRACHRDLGRTVPRVYQILPRTLLELLSSIVLNFLGLQKAKRILQRVPIYSLPFLLLTSCINVHRCYNR